MMFRPVMTWPERIVATGSTRQNRRCCNLLRTVQRQSVLTQVSAKIHCKPDQIIAQSSISNLFFRKRPQVRRTKDQQPVLRQRMRAATRYRLRFPVLLTWVLEGSGQTDGGFTRDVSTMGLFVESTTAIPVGTPINVDLLIQPRSASGSGAHLRGAGSVVRLGGLREAKGFAIAAQLGFAEKRLSLRTGAGN
jgi:hypothetical protein